MRNVLKWGENIVKDIKESLDLGKKTLIFGNKIWVRELLGRFLSLEVVEMFNIVRERQ